MSAVIDFIKKYKHAFVILIYLPVYLLWFFWLEAHVTADYHIIESSLDAYIPFCEYFIVPYLLWFPFIVAAVMFFIFKDKQEYYRLCGILITGMTFFLILSTLWPNGVALRPDLSTLGRDNFFLDLVAGLHKADTSTNVFPSLHAYNSLVVCFALCTSAHLKKHTVIKAGTVILTVLICLSTVYLKQHSVLDIIGALVLFAVLTPVFYGIFAYRRRRNSVAESVTE